MKKTIKIYMALFAITLFIASCKKDDDSNNNTPTNCTNLTGWIRDGHKWVYSNEPILFFADTLYVSCFSTSTQGVFRSEDLFDDGSFYPIYKSYTKPCGNDLYSSSTEDMANANIPYKLNGSIGNSWTSTTTTTLGYTATNTISIAAKNVSITVPAGTFLCDKYHVISTSNQPGSITVTTDIYLNNDYGMILTDGNTSHYELVRKNF